MYKFLSPDCPKCAGSLIPSISFSGHLEVPIYMCEECNLQIDADDVEDFEMVIHKGSKSMPNFEDASVASQF